MYEAFDWDMQVWNMVLRILDGVTDDDESSKDTQMELRIATKVFYIF